MLSKVFTLFSDIHCCS